MGLYVAVYQLADGFARHGRQRFAVADAQENLRIGTVNEGFILQWMAHGRDFAGLVEVGVGDARFGEAQEQVLQGTAGCDPGGNAVVAAGEEHEMRGGGDVARVGEVLFLGIEHAARDGARDEGGQGWCAKGGIADAVAGGLHVFGVKTYPGEEFGFEGGGVELGVVACHDVLRKGLRFAAVDGKGLYADAVGVCRAVKDGVQGVFGDTAAVVGGAVGAVLRDGIGQRILHNVSRGFEGDGDAVLIRLRDAGAVAARAGGKAEVFQRAAEADVKLAVVGIDDGQGRPEIGTEGDLSVADGESPRLGIVTGGCFACLFEDVQVIGIESIHEVLLLRVSPMVSVLPEDVGWWLWRTSRIHVFMP